MRTRETLNKGTEAQQSKWEKRNLRTKIIHILGSPKSFLYKMGRKLDGGKSDGSRTNTL